MQAAGVCLVPIVAPLVLASAAGDPGEQVAFAPAEQIAFAPGAGVRAKKTFTVEHALVLQKLKLDDGSVGQVSQQQMELASKQTLRVTDEYRSSNGGRPLLLERVYDDISLHVDLEVVDSRGQKRPDAWDAQSPLKDASVVFTWVPEDHVYGRYYAGKETLEEYLGGVEEDLDLRALLPGRETKAGDAWTIEPARLESVFSPGGRLPLGFTNGGGGFFARTLAWGVGGALAEVFGGETKGHVQARHAATRDEGGTALAVIAVEVEIETRRDQTDFARGALSREELFEGRAVDHASVQWSFKGSGELVWNVAAGRFETFQLAGHEEVTLELAIRSPQRETPLVQSVSMAGSLKISAEATAKAK